MFFFWSIFVEDKEKGVCVWWWWGRLQKLCVGVYREGERMNVYLLGVESICYDEFFSHCGWSPSQTFPHSTPPRLYHFSCWFHLHVCFHIFIATSNYTWESWVFFNPTGRYDLVDVFLSLPAFSENTLDMCWVSWGVQWWSLHSSSRDAGHT